jgi:hypothetical protein
VSRALSPEGTSCGLLWQQLESRVYTMQNSVHVRYSDEVPKSVSISLDEAAAFMSDVLGPDALRDALGGNGSKGEAG